MYSCSTFPLKRIGNQNLSMFSFRSEAWVTSYTSIYKVTSLCIYVCEQISIRMPQEKIIWVYISINLHVSG